jgi:hypothetical protein
MFGGIFKKIGRVLKSIGKVFITIGKLFTNFPKMVICFLKLLVIVAIRFILKVPGVNIVYAYAFYGPLYLVQLLVKLAVATFMFAFVALIAFIDVIFGNMTSTNNGGASSIGARMTRFVMMFTSCFNDPRAWYTTRRWHRGNRYGMFMGVYPCMAPCWAGYEPKPNGILCGRADPDSPDYCTAAAITRVAEGMSYTPKPGIALSGEDCADIEMTPNQKNLVRLVCQQPEEYDNNFLRVACFERYCARPSDSDYGPSTCKSLVPYHNRRGSVNNQLAMMFLFLAGGACFFFTMSSALRTKQDEFVILSRSYVQSISRDTIGDGKGAI